MTGHLFGDNTFKMPYRNITNVEVSFGFGGGYFEVSAGGIQNTDKIFWSTDKKSDPAKQPNTISLTASHKAIFIEASNLILEKISEINTPSSTLLQEESVADEIRKFKELLDDGIITQEEFDAKKKELLGL